MRSSTATALAALVCLFATQQLCCEEIESTDALTRIRQQGILEVAVYSEFPPFSSGDSAAAAAGIDVDLARAIASRLGVRLKLRMVSAGDESGSAPG